ncbi:hypothetical protein F53441_11378 [Fusarium austroafricanum]|uniref:Uncharacterized protein n=1 Tax=Fusarium austroafricanum TaxID=2364996 RepID=A0A8H4NTF4_9HYPO|nr:hypothetical protein F53441_11378 [Fusarium austroafricanum]
MTTYRAEVMQRRQLLAMQNGVRPIDPDAARDWDLRNMLREDPNDSGYKLWLVMLEAFAEGVLAALNADDTLNDEWIVEMLEEIPV